MRNATPEGCYISHFFFFFFFLILTIHRFLWHSFNSRNEIVHPPTPLCTPCAPSAPPVTLNYQLYNLWLESSSGFARLKFPFSNPFSTCQISLALFHTPALFTTYRHPPPPTHTTPYPFSICNTNFMHFQNKIKLTSYIMRQNCQ